MFEVTRTSFYSQLSSLKHWSESFPFFFYRVVWLFGWKNWLSDAEVCRGTKKPRVWRVSVAFLHFVVRLFTDKAVVTLWITFSGRVLKKGSTMSTEQDSDRSFILEPYGWFLPFSLYVPWRGWADTLSGYLDRPLCRAWKGEVKSWTMELIVKHLKSSLFALYRGWAPMSVSKIRKGSLTLSVCCNEAWPIGKIK